MNKTARVGLLQSFLRRHCHFGALVFGAIVIVCKNIILALSFRRSRPARIGGVCVEDGCYLTAFEASCGRLKVSNLFSEVEARMELKGYFLNAISCNVFFKGRTPWSCGLSRQP